MSDTAALEETTADRIKRAQQAGFDTSKVWYHGTAGDISELSRSGVFWVSATPNLASEYATTELAGMVSGDSEETPVSAANLIPVFTRTRKPIHFRHAEQEVTITDLLVSALSQADQYGSKQRVHSLFDTLSDRYQEQRLPLHEFWHRDPDVAEYLRALGFDAIIVDERRDRRNRTLGALYPSNVRSVNARFDPTLDSAPQLLFKRFHAKEPTGRSPAEDSANYLPASDQTPAARLNRALMSFGMPDHWQNAFEAIALPSHLHPIDQAFRSAFNREVVAVRPTDEQYNIFNGIYDPSDSHTLYVNAAADAGFLQLAGHELLHAMRNERPALYGWFVEQTRPYIFALERYRDTLNSLLDRDETLYTSSAALEELIADAAGDALADKAFLKELASASPKRFNQLANACDAWAGETAVAVQGLDSDAHIAELEVFRRHLRLALVAFTENIPVEALLRSNGEFPALSDTLSKPHPGTGPPNTTAPPDRSLEHQASAPENHPYDLGLPMDEEARLARARAMGFDTTRIWYHGTEKAGFPAFDLDSVGSNTRNAEDGFYFTESLENAATYSGTRSLADIQANVGEIDEDGYEIEIDPEPGIYRVYLRLGECLEVDFEGRDWQGADEEGNFTGSWTVPEVEAFAKENGFDSVVISNVLDEGRHGVGYHWGAQTVIVFDPSDIRSVEAAFNPAHEDSAQLLFKRKSHANQTASSTHTANDDTGRLARAKALGFNTDRVLYHQTSTSSVDSIFDDGFDLSQARARNRLADCDVPDAVFLKSHDKDIGLHESDEGTMVSVPLYAAIQHPLRVESRLELTQFLQKHNSTYAELRQEYEQCDINYDAQIDVIWQEMLDLTRDSRDISDAAARFDAKLAEWKGCIRDIAKLCRWEAAQTLRSLGYDAVEMERDEGSWGRSTDAVMVLDPTKIRSVNADFSPSHADKPQLLFSRNRHKPPLFRQEIAEMNSRQLHAGIRTIEAEQRKREILLSSARAIREYALSRGVSVDSMQRLLTSNYKNNALRLEAYRIAARTQDPDPKLNIEFRETQEPSRPRFAPGPESGVYLGHFAGADTYLEDQGREKFNIVAKFSGAPDDSMTMPAALAMKLNANQSLLPPFDQALKASMGLPQHAPKASSPQPNQRNLLLDSDGTPLVVYRGEHGASGERTGRHSRGPSITYGSKSVAEQYATSPNRRADRVVNPVITKAHLVMKAPFVNTPDDPFIDFPVLINALGRNKALDVALKYSEHIENTSKWHELADTYPSVKSMLSQRPEELDHLYIDAYPVLDDPDVVDALKQSGYDGAIHCGNGLSAMDVEYKVFSPDQVVVLQHMRLHELAPTIGA